MPAAAAVLRVPMMPAFLRRIGDAFTLQMKRKRWLALAIFSDLAFLFLLTQAQYYFFTRASDAVFTLMRVIQQQASAVASEATGGGSQKVNGA